MTPIYAVDNAKAKYVNSQIRVKYKHYSLAPLKNQTFWSGIGGDQKRDKSMNK